MARTAARLRVTGGAALNARARLASVGEGEVGTQMAGRHRVRGVACRDEPGDARIGLERRDRGKARRIHVTSLAALSRVTYGAARLRFGGRDTVRLEKIGLLVRRWPPERSNGGIGQGPRLHERDVTGATLGVHQVRRRAMLVAGDAEARALPLHRHERGIAALRVAAPAVERRVDAEVGLAIVLGVGEAEVGWLALRTVPGHARDLASIVTTDALLDRRISLGRALIEYAGVTSNAGGEKPLVLRVRETRFVGAADGHRRRRADDREDESHRGATSHRSFSGEPCVPGSPPIVHSRRSDARV